MKSYNLIFLRNSKVVLSKKTYSDWKEIQTDFDDYMSSLDFDTIDNLAEYLSIEYKIDSELIKTQLTQIDSTELEQLELTL